MRYMKRLFLASACTTTLALIVPALALAQVIELGKTSTPLVSPSCPANVTAAQCTIVLTRVTALPSLRDGVAYPTRVHHDGYIVGFTVGVSALTGNRTLRKSYIHNLDVQFGGVPVVYVTVLKPVGKASLLQWKVVADSSKEPAHLIPYMGEVVQFPLKSAVPVQAGDVVALTTSSWAPILSIQQSKNKFSYRQSRSANCNNTPALPQSQVVGQSARYKCDYAGTRLEYTATEITTPPYPSDYVHAPDLPGAFRAGVSAVPSASGGAGLIR